MITNILELIMADLTDFISDIKLPETWDPKECVKFTSERLKFTLTEYGTVGRLNGAMTSIRKTYATTMAAAPGVIQRLHHQVKIDADLVTIEMWGYAKVRK